MAGLRIRADRLNAAATGLLAAMYLVYSFVTLHPFVSPDLGTRVDGSPLDRLFVLAMGGVAVLVLALNGRLSLLLLRRSAVVWLLTGWCGLSLAWSAFPDLTVRRALLLVLLNGAAFAIAVGLRNLYRAHVVVVAVLALVVAVNLASAIVLPGLAWSDIGLKGIYTQKNVAGMVGMIATFAALTWLFGARRPLALVLGSGLVGLDLVFLVLTESKTSLGLAVGFGILVPALVLVLAHGAAQRRFVLVATLLAVVIIALLAMLSNLGRDDLLTLVFGDPTFTRRTDIWSFVWSEITRRPWLGAGYGAFWDVGDAFDPLLRAPPGTFLTDVEAGVINQSHNGYLEIWLQVGLPALILSLAMLAQASAAGLDQAVRGGISRRQRATATFLLLVIVVYAFDNLMEATLFMRGLLLNNVAMLAMFILYRLTLDDRIAERLEAAEAAAGQTGAEA